MNKADVEFRVIQVLDRLVGGRPIEDSYVELKKSWVPAEPAARMIGGLANASHGEPILWIVGVHEKSRTVVGAADQELAVWLPQVKAEFDDLSPDLLLNLVVPYGGVEVVVLLFDTSRRPYVLKRGGERDVPWREGNQTRSARREDLIRLLVPAQRRPRTDILASHILILSGTKQTDAKEWVSWGKAELEFYLTVTTETPIVIPSTGARRSSPSRIGSKITPFEALCCHRRWRNAPSRTGTTGERFIVRIRSRLTVRGPR